jgi:hypothetical protein
MNQRKPKRLKPPGGKAGVVADAAENWSLPASKVKRVMDALPQVWTDRLRRGEEVPMPGGAAQVIFSKPTQRWRFMGQGVLLRGKKPEQLKLKLNRIKNPDKNISFRANVEFVKQKDGQFYPRRRELDRSHRRAWKPGAPKPKMSREPTQQKRKGPKPPPAPEPLMLPRDAETLAENRNAYYRRLELERAAGRAAPTVDRFQVPSRTAMFRKGKR